MSFTRQKKKRILFGFEPGGTYDVTLKGLHVTGEGLQNPVIWVFENSVVNLTLDGDNLLDTRKAYLGNYSAISIAPDCTLNITGNGTLTTISSYWPSILTHGACQINISGENTAVKAYWYEIRHHNAVCHPGR